MSAARGAPSSDIPVFIRRHPLDVIGGFVGHHETHYAICMLGIHDGRRRPDQSVRSHRRP